MDSQTWEPPVVLVVESHQDDLDAIVGELRSTTVRVGTQERAEFDVRAASTAGEALEKRRNVRPVAIILGVVAGPDGLDAVEVCRRIRMVDPQVYVIMLGGEPAEVDAALDAGGDEHQLKEGAWAEALPSRVRAGLRRRSGGGLPPRLRCSGFVIDTGSRTLVLADGSRVQLTSTEFWLLMRLYQADGQPVSRETLVDDVWGLGTPVALDTVNQVVRRLRVKLDDKEGNRIRAITGTGYALERGVPTTMNVVLVVDDIRGDRAAMTSALCRPTVVVGENAQPEFKVVEASTAEEALKMWRDEVPDAIVLDIGLGRSLPDGRTVTEEIRRTDHQTYIIIVSVFDTVEHIDQNLLAGADEYQIKRSFGPHYAEALPARVRAGLRGRDVCGGPFSARVTCGGLILDREWRVVILGDGSRVPLTPTDFRLLDFMLDNEGQTLSRQQLADRVWGYPDGNKNTVDAAVSRLRKKLGEHLSQLQTFRNDGFRLDCQ